MRKTILVILLVLLCGWPTVSSAQSANAEPLKLIATIPLPDVQGRIDHLSIDMTGQRLFVAVPRKQFSRNHRFERK